MENPIFHMDDLGHLSIYCFFHEINHPAIGNHPKFPTIWQNGISMDLPLLDTSINI